MREFTNFFGSLKLEFLLRMIHRPIDFCIMLKKIKVSSAYYTSGVLYSKSYSNVKSNVTY